MTKKIDFICMFENGNIVVCSGQKQVSALQKNPIVEIMKKARKLGYEVSDECEILLPSGTFKKVKGYDNYQEKDET